jgi:signal transduction histidine kinase
VLWCTTSFFGLAVSMVLCLVIYVGARLTAEEKHELGELSERLIEVIDLIEASGGPLSQSLTDDRMAELNTPLRMLFDDEHFNLTYAVYATDNSLLYAFTRGDIDLFPAALRQRKTFSVDFQTYKDWRFLQLTDSASYRVVVCSSHHLDAIDHVLIGLAALLPLTLAFSALVGVMISRRVLTPITLIAGTVGEIEVGNLAARITPLPGDDEIAQLIVKLNHAFAQLQASFEQASQFSGDAAHELRTPLTALRGNLEVCIRQSRTSEEYQQVIGLAIEEISRMHQIIESLLMLARDPGGSERHPFVDVDLGAVVARTVEQLGVVAEAREITLVAEAATGLALRGDPGFLNQLTYNLVHNAIKFTPDGGRVELRAEAQGAQLQLSVTDNGNGVPAGLRDKVFDRFYQADSSRKTGFGLGLSLAKWIVDLHHGSIELTGNVAGGTTVIVRLPAEKRKGA